MMKKIVCVLLALCLFVIGAAGCARIVEDAPAADSDSAAVSDSQDNTASDAAADYGLPDIHSFTADTRDGGSFTDKNLAKYDVTIINCWATYCGPCIAEMPQIAEYERALPDNVQLITFCLDGADCFDEMCEILDDAGYTGTTLVYGHDDLYNLGYQLKYVPTTVFVDSKGNIVAEPIIGASENVAATYQAVVDGILNQ